MRCSSLFVMTRFPLNNPERQFVLWSADSSLNAKLFWQKSISLMVITEIPVCGQSLSWQFYSKTLTDSQQPVSTSYFYPGFPYHALGRNIIISLIKVWLVFVCCILSDLCMSGQSLSWEGRAFPEHYQAVFNLVYDRIWSIIFKYRAWTVPPGVFDRLNVQGEGAAQRGNRNSKAALSMSNE